MYDHTTEMLQARVYDQAQCGEFGSAVTLYVRSRRHGQRGSFWSSRSRDSRHLLDLSKIEGGCQVDSRCYAGLHTVPIEQIRGSEGRSDDFDRHFHPLQDHCMSRWLRVARARDQDKVLPPVVLIQVGDVYFVRDGHHRISVARALGQLDIEAEVTVWHVSGPLPWEVPSTIPDPTSQETAVRWILGTAQRGSARLQERLAAVLRHLLIVIRVKLGGQVVPQVAAGRS
jgi:hypothetical protein